jgi:uncharacterized membrane protein (UPF0182 family)
MTPEQYVREAIQQFAVDPAENSYQEGYYDALVTVAREAFGLRLDQTHTPYRPPQMARLTVIDGGKDR